MGGDAGRNFAEDVQVASLGTFTAKPQGEAIQYDTIQEAGTVRYTPFTFGLGFRATHEAMADELYNVLNKMSAELGASAAHQLEVQAHRVLNNGFSTTGTTALTAAGFDTLSLFSTAHVLKRGGTYANRQTTDLDLSVTAVELASDSMNGTVNESNMPTPKRLATLLVPYQLKWVAKEITQSELKPYTGDNEVNPLGGAGLQYMESHYLTDPDSWFGLAAKADHDLNVWIRESPMIDMRDDDDTFDMKVRGIFRVATGHGDWRGSFGSLGA
jgi:hypothetical protein